jgi:hypothetical protein
MNSRVCLASNEVRSWVWNEAALGPPLWSSGQSSWLQIQRSRVRFTALPDFLRSSGSGTVPAHCATHILYPNFTQCFWSLLLSVRSHLSLLILIQQTGKSIPVTGSGGPQGFETSRLPHFVDSRLTDGGEVVSHNTTGRIRSIWKSNDLIGSRTSDLPDCSIESQPITLPRAPNIINFAIYYNSNHTWKSK